MVWRRGRGERRRLSRSVERDGREGAGAASGEAEQAETLSGVHDAPRLPGETRPEGWGQSQRGAHQDAKEVTGHPSGLNSLSLRRHDANSWLTTRRGARGMATRSAGSRKSSSRGYGFMVFVTRTPCC